jgi:hypothetical protein
MSDARRGVIAEEDTDEPRREDPSARGRARARSVLHQIDVASAAPSDQEPARDGDGGAEQDTQDLPGALGHRHEHDIHKPGVLARTLRRSRSSVSILVCASLISSAELNFTMMVRRYRARSARGPNSRRLAVVMGTVHDAELLADRRC